MRRKINNKISHLKIVLKSVILFGVIGSFFWLHQYLFIVKKIDCSVELVNQCDQAIVAELTNLIGLNLININTQNISQKIMGAYPDIVNIDFDPKLPGLINVGITKTKPLSKIAQSSSSAVLVIQDNGYLTDLVATSDSNLPIIYYQKLPYQEKTVKIEDKTLIHAIDLVKIFSEYFISVSQIDIDANNSAYIKLDNGPIAIFDLYSDPKRQIESLQLILSKTSTELPIKTVDVRLTKPVITTAESD